MTAQHRRIPTRRSRTAVNRATVSLLLATVLGLWLGTSGTLSSFTVARLGNSTGSAASAKLGIVNSQGGAGCAGSAGDTQVACTASLYPASVTLGGSGSQTNAVTDNGTVAAGMLTASYQVPACGPVALANTGSGAGAGVLLPRTGTTFSPTSGPFAGGGSIALAGSGYAASVGSTTAPTADGNYGLGIWFTGSASGIQPLFSLTSAATTPTANTDRTLYLSAGKPTFAVTAGSALVSSTAYPSGWHFAYVSIQQSSVLLTLVPSLTVSLYVDGTRVATTTTGTRVAAASGYWHVGTARIGNATSTLTGSISGFVVDDSGSAPTAGATPTSYTGFDTTATQRWNLNDSGGSYSGGTAGGIYTGTTYPAGGNPCASITATWTATNPAGTIATSATLASLSTAKTITTVPGPGVTQTQTLQLSVPGSLNAYGQGLIIYAPVVATYGVTGNTTWNIGFVWNAPAAGSTAGSTFVIA